MHGTGLFDIYKNQFVLHKVILSVFSIFDLSNISLIVKAIKNLYCISCIQDYRGVQTARNHLAIY